jgi:hypothetical protein
MNKAELIQKIANVNDVLDRSSDIADSELSNLRRVNSPQSPVKIEETIAGFRAAGRRLNIGVIGRVKAGKSSLINALLFDGATVLPKAATPMTAALTTIEYGEKFSAEVEFFSPNDIRKLKQKHEEQKLLVQHKVEEKTASILERLARRANPDAVQPDRQKVEAQVLRDIEKDNPSLAAASDLYQRMIDSGVDIGTLGESRKLEAQSLGELKGELNRYVGADGEFMPFTKTLGLSLADESLLDIKVIDTPGVNDAVASREQRTYEMLNQCDVVFIVSPAGQFLNSQDLELTGRLTQREGVREVFVVASQVDTQLHGDIRSSVAGNLPKALKKVRSILARQGDDVLRNQGNEVLRSIAGEQSQRLLLSSGICQTLLAQLESEWDEGADHVYRHLQADYPDYFGDRQEAENYLQQLSGREGLRHRIASVKEQKERIQDDRKRDYLSDQASTCEAFVSDLIAYFARLRQKISSADMAELEQRLQKLEKIKSQGERAARHVFEDKVEELDFALSDQLKSMADDIFGDNREEIKSSEKMKTETYRAKKDGVVASLTRFFSGGGYETRTREFAVVDASEIRESLEKLFGFVEDGINDTTRRILKKWRNNLESELVRAVREVMGDKSEYLESDALTSACRRAIAEIADFPDAKLPAWPEELSSSEKKKGREAEEHITLAKDCYADLRGASRAHVKKLRSHIELLGTFQLERHLFNTLKNDMEQQQQLVAHRELSLKKLERITSELESLSHD